MNQEELLLIVGKLYVEIEQRQRLIVHLQQQIQSRDQKINVLEERLGLKEVVKDGRPPETSINT